MVSTTISKLTILNILQTFF